MTGRALVLIAVAGLLAGCANEAIPAPASFNAMQLGAESPGPEADELAETAPAALQRTRASKVLSAMAFERVTGNKVDPARLLAGE